MMRFGFEGSRLKYAKKIFIFQNKKALQIKVRMCCIISIYFILPQIVNANCWLSKIFRYIDSFINLNTLNNKDDLSEDLRSINHFFKTKVE